MERDRRKVKSGEYDVRLAEMLEAMKAHIEADARSFSALFKQLAESSIDIKSILESRARAAGMVAIIQWSIGGGVVVAVLGLLWRAFAGGH
jgi:hypothetical protein